MFRSMNGRNAWALRGTSVDLHLCTDLSVSANFIEQAGVILG